MTWVTRLLVVLAMTCVVDQCCSAETTDDPYLWPWPEHIEYGDAVLALSRDFHFQYPNPNPNPNPTTPGAGEDLRALLEIYRKFLVPSSETNVNADPSGEEHALAAPLSCLRIAVSDANSGDWPSLETDESYALAVVPGDTCATLKAATYSGVVRGLETFSQLVETGTDGTLSVRCAPVTIRDAPRFPYRGLLIDTARHFLSVRSIKKTLDGMMFSKMNVLHWHIVDAQSFPLQTKAFPDLSVKGAYSSDQTYSPADIQDVLVYARVRGVRVIPEIDTPGHTYSWGVGYPELTVCGGASPWGDYCAEPPCGQLNPVLPFTYEVVGAVLKEVASAFPDEFLHVGFDEVNFACWNTSAEIRSAVESGQFANLTDVLQYFASTEAAIVQNAQRTPMYWEEVFDSGIQVDPKAVIEVWKSFDVFYEILKKTSNRVVLANSDAMYLDCGAGNWITGGASWCAPYKSWQTIYLNEPFPKNATEKYDENRLLGTEVCLWSEQVDETNLDQKLWPRAAAAAERQWSPRDVDDVVTALPRLVAHRARLVRRGLQAEPLQPTWCQHNPGKCGIDA